MIIKGHNISNVFLLIAGAILVVLIVFVFLSIPSCQKPVITPQQSINEIKAELEKQHKFDLAKKDLEIKDWKSRFVVSDAKYKILVDKYTDLERRKNEVKLPTTNTELRDRFTALGYPPLAVK